jgi:hypothetical protein
MKAMVFQSTGTAPLRHAFARESSSAKSHSAP